jgi:hypothetical protein
MTKRSRFRMQLFASAPSRDGARTQTCRALATGSEKLQRLRHLLHRFGPASNRLERGSQIIIGYTETVFNSPRRFEVLGFSEFPVKERNFAAGLW